MLGTAMPYFEDNPYAMCVYNHLAIDMACEAYTETAQKLSFAISLCLKDDLFKAYPELSWTQ